MGDNFIKAADAVFTAVSCYFASDRLLRCGVVLDELDRASRRARRSVGCRGYSANVVRDFLTRSENQVNSTIAAVAVCSHAELS
jgi:hypothetical protein